MTVLTLFAGSASLADQIAEIPTIESTLSTYQSENKVDLVSYQVGTSSGQSDSYDWRDTLSFFLGYEGSKQPQDFGINAHFGARAAVNWGVPVLQDWGLGLQVGSSINPTANAVQVMERVEGTSSRTQSFTTVGLFQRTPLGLKWALVYDFLYEKYYDNFSMSQVRGLVGYQFSNANECGTRFMIPATDDGGNFGATPVTLRPIAQVSAYWRHICENQVNLSCWAGWAEGHSEANAALGDLPPQKNVFVYGTDLYVPLNDTCAIFGQANFITPADTGTVDAYLGMEFYFWGGAKLARQRRFSPVLPVANNTSMAVDLLR